MMNGIRNFIATGAKIEYKKIVFDKDEFAKIIAKQEEVINMSFATEPEEIAVNAYSSPQQSTISNIPFVPIVSGPNNKIINEHVDVLGLNIEAISNLPPLA